MHNTTSSASPRNTAPRPTLSCCAMSPKSSTRAPAARACSKSAFALRRPERPRFIDHQHATRVEPVAPTLEVRQQLRTVRASMAASSPSVRAASPATAAPVTRNPASSYAAATSRCKRDLPAPAMPVTIARSARRRAARRRPVAAGRAPRRARVTPPPGGAQQHRRCLEHRPLLEDDPLERIRIAIERQQRADGASVARCMSAS